MNDTQASLPSLLSRAYGITPVAIRDAPRGFVADPSAERRWFHLSELRQTCFVWLWPAVRRLDQASDEP